MYPALHTNHLFKEMFKEILLFITKNIYVYCEMMLK